MKFRVEVLRSSSVGTEVLHQTTVEAMSPRAAKVLAAELLSRYGPRGANGARVLNSEDEEIYTL